MIGARFYTIIDDVLARGDNTEDELRLAFEYQQMCLINSHISANGISPTKASVLNFGIPNIVHKI